MPFVLFVLSTLNLRAYCVKSQVAKSEGTRSAKVLSHYILKERIFGISQRTLLVKFSHQLILNQLIAEVISSLNDTCDGIAKKKNSGDGTDEVLRHADHMTLFAFLRTHDLVTTVICPLVFSKVVCIVILGLVLCVLLQSIAPIYIFLAVCVNINHKKSKQLYQARYYLKHRSASES